MTGQIVKIISDLFYVEFEDNLYSCKCRGIFRKEHIIPVVGDYVLFNKDKKIIEKVLPRKNLFDRPKVSNIDQAFLVTSLKSPDFSFYLLDKFLVLMEMKKVIPIICITKEDLVPSFEEKTFQSIFSYYEKIGYVVVSNQDLSTIKELLKDKVTAFTGQTGAGKSTLLNQLNSNWNLEVGEISHALGRGKHTTRVVQMFPFLGGKVVDTPGFSSLELSSSIDPVKSSFIEFSNYLCPYRDCTHTNEEECAVKKAVFRGEILKSRYENYLSFLGGKSED